MNGKLAEQANPGPAEQIYQEPAELFNPGSAEQLIRDLSEIYYRMALAAASKRNLSVAVIYARHACLLDAAHENAKKLLDLCLFELGELPQAPNNEYSVVFEQIRDNANRKKWKAAARLARSIPRQSVKDLNILGCIYGCAKLYATAARYFAKALEKDRGNRLAIEGLTDSINRRKRFLGKIIDERFI